MKLGIIVGHNSRAQGANAVAPISASEYEYNGELAEIMDDLATGHGIDAKIFKRRSRGSFRREIQEVYGKTDAWGAEATIELHFNAYNGRVRGTETLSGPSGKSLRIATAVQRQLVELYDRNALTDRGVKTYRPGMRGGSSLITGRAPAILVEPFFGDSMRDAELADQIGQEALARAYLEGIAAATGVPAESLVDSDEAEPAGDAVDFGHWR